MNTLFKTVTDSQKNGHSQETVVPLQKTTQTTSQTVLIEGLELMAYIGVLEHEKNTEQRLSIDAEINVTSTLGSQSDDIENVLSYAAVIKDIKAVIAEGHVNLVETLADKIIEKVSQYPQALSIKLSVKKPDIIEETANVGVTVNVDFG